MAIRGSDQRAQALGTEITTLCSTLFAAEYRLLCLIREFDDKEYWASLGVLSCAHWLQWQCGIGMNAAREKVRVAHALAELPQISAAFSMGELSYSKVRALTRIAEPGNEDYLLMIARHGAAHHVEKLVSQARRLERLEDIEQANEKHAARALDYHTDESGCVVIRARLPAEQGTIIIKALEAAMDCVFRVEGASDVTAVTPPVPEPEPVACRRADALVEVAETYLNSEPVPSSTADRYQVVVHTDADALQSVDDHTAVRSDIDNGPHLAAETARRLACDASIVQLLEDGHGEPLAIGRRTRAVPPAMQRALRARDGGCCFPGCTRTRFVDAHHIKHWADGGQTALNNLALLCRAHHRLVHEGGFGCAAGVDGTLRFTGPGGRPLESSALLPGVAVDREPRSLLEDLCIEHHIEPEACVPHWAGERADWDMALEGLGR